MFVNGVRRRRGRRGASAAVGAGAGRPRRGSASTCPRSATAGVLKTAPWTRLARAAGRRGSAAAARGRRARGVPPGVLAVPLDRRLPGHPAAGGRTPAGGAGHHDRALRRRATAHRHRRRASGPGVDAGCRRSQGPTPSARRWRPIWPGWADRRRTCLPRGLASEAAGQRPRTSTRTARRATAMARDFPIGGRGRTAAAALRDARPAAAGQRGDAGVRRTDELRKALADYLAALPAPKKGGAR